MNMKKIAALFVALVMALSMATLTATAATASKLEIKTSVSVFEGTDFTLDVYITPGDAAKKLAAFQFDFTYDTDKVAIAKDELGLPVITTPYAAAQMVAGAQSANDETGVVKFSFSASAAFITAGLNVPADYKIASFGFKAKEGDAAVGQIIETLDRVKFEDQNAVAEQLSDETLDDSLVDLTAIAVQEIPNAPSVDVTGGITGDLEAGQTVTANYSFNNGAMTNNPADDASEIVWYAGETKVKEATADEDKTLTLTNAMVGATIKYEVTPKVDRAEALNPVGTKQTSAASAIVAPADGYVPVATVTLAEESIATLDVVYGIDLDNVTKAFAVAEDKTTVAWYVAAAPVTEEAGLEGLTPVELEEGEAYAPAVADRDKYAVLVVTPSIKVGEASYPGAKVIMSTLIKGEPPVIDASGIDTEVKLTVGRTLKTDAVVIDEKLPEGTESTNPVASYAWYAIGLDEEITEETVAVGTADKLKLTSDMKDKRIVLHIDFTNTLNIPAETAVVSYAGVVQKASGSATQGGTSLVTGGTTTPGTTEPGTDKPVDEKDPADPAGTANDKGAAVFTDVDKEAYAWAYEGIDALTKAGVIKGMTETTFGPELTATNAQMIALAVRIAGLTAEDAKTDKVDADHWVAAELAVADAKGILSVYGEKIDVEGATSREIAFTLLYNALKTAGVELPETAEAIEFTDAASIDPNCVEAINALVKAGIVNGMGDGTLAPKATLTRAQLAKILGLANALVTK